MLYFILIMSLLYNIEVRLRCIAFPAVTAIEAELYYLIDYDSFLYILLIYLFHSSRIVYAMMTFIRRCIFNTNS